VTKLKIIVAADGAFGIRLLNSLIVSKHKICGVFSSTDQGSFRRFSERNGLHIWNPEKFNDKRFANEIKRAEIDLIVSLRFPYIFPDYLLSIPRLGCVNLHTGPLPTYAGLNAVSWAIYNGEKTHHVTLHKVEKDIDSGPIVDRAIFDIREDDNGLSVMKKCVNYGVPLIIKFIEDLAQGNDIILTRQCKINRKYHGPEIPLQGLIDWNLQAFKIYNFIRACDFLPFDSPWGSPVTYYKTEKIGILKAQITGKPCNKLPGTLHRDQSSDLYAATEDEWLQLLLVKRDGNIVDAREAFSSKETMGNMRLKNP